MRSCDKFFAQAYGTRKPLVEVTCHCGKCYYQNSKKVHDEAAWKRIKKDKTNIPIKGELFMVYLDGVAFVDACGCWHKRAKVLGDLMKPYHKDLTKFLGDITKKSLEGIISRLKK